MPQLDKNYYKSYSLYRDINRVFHVSTSYYSDFYILDKEDPISEKICSPNIGDSVYYLHTKKFPVSLVNKYFKKSKTLDDDSILILPFDFNLAVGSMHEANVNTEHQVILVGDVENLKKAECLPEMEFLKHIEFEKKDIIFVRNNHSQEYKLICAAKKIAYDCDLLQKIRQNVEFEINEDVINKIWPLLKSNDYGNNVLALTMLSELNYIDYKNTVRTLLTKSNKNWDKISFSSKNINYMFNYINAGLNLYFDDVKECEQKFIKDQIINEIKGFLSYKIPCIIKSNNINIDYDINVTFD